MSKLAIVGLKVKIGEKEILKGVDLVVNQGEVHAVMGPNGSGKSTLANTLAGHPACEVTEGEISLEGRNVLEMAPDERARVGLFLAFQYPAEVVGVRVQNFLKVAYEQRFAGREEKKFKSVLAFRSHLQNLADKLGVKRGMLNRGLNEGFSGGEKKRLEILQMALLEPVIAILDEIDSGLDIDAIRTVAAGVKHVVERCGTGVVVITHYQRILNHLTPDRVHVMMEGKMERSGGLELVTKLEESGYMKEKGAQSE